MTTFERLKKAITDNGLHLSGQNNTDIAITEETRFLEDLGMDSLDLVELVMTAEEEFKVEITDAQAEKLLTMGDAVAFIDSLSHA